METRDKRIEKACNLLARSLELKKLWKGMGGQSVVVIYHNTDNGVNQVKINEFSFLRKALREEAIRLEENAFHILADIEKTTTLDP